MRNVIVLACLFGVVGVFQGDGAKASELETIISNVKSYCQENANATYRYSHVFSRSKILSNVPRDWIRVELAIDLSQRRIRVLEVFPPIQSDNEDQAEKLPAFIEAVRTDNRFLHLSGEGETVRAVTSSLNNSIDNFRDQLERDFCVLFGILPIAGEHRIGELLTIMDVDMRRTGSLIELTGKQEAAGATLRLVVDPDRNFAPRIIEWSGNPVGAAQTKRFVFEVISFGVANAPNVPAEFSSETAKTGGEKTIEALGGEIVRVEPRVLFSRTKIESVELNPKFTDADFQVLKQIPNGTNVAMKDAFHLRHVWQDGKAMPVLDEDVIRDPAIGRFLGKIANISGQFWLVVLACVALGAAAYFHLKGASEA